MIKRKGDDTRQGQKGRAVGIISTTVFFFALKPPTHLYLNAVSNSFYSRHPTYIRMGCSVVLREKQGR